MRENSKYTLLYYIGLIVSFVCSSCDSKTVYNHYQHVSIAGWEKNDALSYEIAPMEHDGTFQETIGLRISNDFPFTGLTLIVEQTVYPSLESQNDTLTCELIDKKGNATGRGATLYQYHFPIDAMTLHKGDSLSIRIRHDMKREILPGVADIGITLTKQ